MPKVKLGQKKDDQRAKAVTFWIFGEQKAKGMTMQELARLSGINENTLYKRKKNPETFRLGELWSLINVLKPKDGMKDEIL